MARSTWSDNDVQQLEAYVLEGFNAGDVSRMMGRSYSSTYNQVLKFNARRFSNGSGKVSKVQDRVCLSCSEKFRSSGPGNRICNGCARLNQGYAGVVYDG